MAVSFVTNIVLARLLSPDDFGTIGMLLLFLALANTFVDSGFGSALIQKKDADQTDFSTVFFINLIFSFAVYIVLFFCAPWVARFYHVDILCPLLRVQGLVLILHAFSIIQTALLRKKMDFRKLSECNLIGNIVGSIVGIYAAFTGCGVWSLVIRTLTVGFVTSLLLWIIGKWKPLPLFSMQSFKELFGFGGFMLLSSIVYSFTNNIQTLIMGKLFTPAILGNYTQAHQLRNVATDSVSSVVSQVLYPEFANNQRDNSVLIGKLNLSVSIISFVCIAIMAVCILVAKPLILLLYGEKWLSCVLYFRIMCVAGCFVALQDVNLNIVAAKGKSRLLFYCNIAKLGLFVLLMLIGAKVGGIIGLIVSINMYILIAYVVFSSLASFELGVNPWMQYRSIVRDYSLAVVPYAITSFINHYLGSVSNVAIILIDLSLFSFLYLFISFLTKNSGFNYLITVFRNIKR